LATKVSYIRLALAIAVSLLGTAYNAFAQTSIASDSLTADRTSSSFQEVENNVFRPGLIRVDFSITSQIPTNWEGELRLSRGEFANPVPLGANASSPTDFLFSDSTKSCLAIYTRSASTFCGVEVTIFAPRDARLEIRLRDRLQNKILAKTVFIDRLIDSAIRIPFDELGNGVEIVRAPADELPLKMEALQGSNKNIPFETSIFHPGDQVRITTLPRSSSTKLPDQLVLTINVRSKDSQEAFYTESRELSLTELQHLETFISDVSAFPKAYEFLFSAPTTSGVFEATLELSSKITPTPKSTFALSPVKRRQEATVFAKRTVQGLVVSSANDENVPSEKMSVSIEDLREESLAAIDPTNSAWYKIFSKRSIIPFYYPNVKGVKSSGDFSSTSIKGLESNEEIDVRLSPVAQRTFETESPEAQSFSIDSSPDTSRLILGQTLGIKNTNENIIGKNLLGLVPNLNGKSENDNALSAEVQLYFLQRWEKDRFQSFVRNLDQNRWGVIANLWEKPLSSGSSRPFNEEELLQFATAQSRFLRLAPNVSGPVNNGLMQSNTISWEAYPIPITTPGAPHILEIEYPVNFPQKLGVSIIEPGPSGGIFPSSFDTGFITSVDSLSDRGSNEIARFTTLFWPQTSTPIILMSNCSSETPAAYGQIRIYRAGSIEKTKDSSKLGRTFGLAFTSPDICRQFSASKKASAFGLTGSEDWNSFEESISRILYYMTATSVDATVMTFVSNGSALYPSQRLNPSPKYDGGIFLPTGGDPIRKDVLSAALAMFAEHHKRLTPLVNFNAPLPMLEMKLNAIRFHSVSAETQASLEGIEWIGADGRKLIDSRLAEDGSGPYYNILHPEVEKEVLNIIKELVTTCSPYDSFDGFALDVGAYGWLALPDDVYYGMDDETIARFVRETNLQEVLSSRGNRRVQELLLAKGVERYRSRAEFIRDVCLNEWIEWRIDALYRFYRQVRLIIADSRPDVRLYLVATNALDGPISRSMLYPSLTNGKRLREALRLVGLDPVRFSSESRKKTTSVVEQVGYITSDPSWTKYDSSITLLRPELVASTAPFVKTALLDDLNDPDAISLFTSTQSHPGTFFYHKPEKRPLYDFSEVSPIRPAVVELQTQALPSGYENRRRFARTLAIEDSLCFFDGGDFVPVGQEKTLQDWINVFKSLPNVQFKTWTPKSDINSIPNEKKTNSSASSEEQTIQPLVVRYYRTEKETWVYLLNAAPFHLGVRLSFNKNSSIPFEVFASPKYETPKAYGNSLDWSFTATPYDLVAIRIDDVKTSIDSIDVSRPLEICGPEGRLNAAVQDFVERLLIARTGVVIPLRNGDFEETLSPNNSGFDDEKLVNSDKFEHETFSNEKKLDRSNLFKLETPKLNPFKRTNDAAQPKEKLTQTSAYTEPDLNSASIPGWRAFGPSDVEVYLDKEIAHNGQNSLCISSKGNIGGVICQPFIPPTTGRLCVQICFGVPTEVSELPLNVCLVGRHNEKPFSRRIHVGAAVLKRSQNLNQKDAENGIVWLRDVVLFDRLPLCDLEDLSLRFELCGNGTVWLDQIRLYKLAFTDSEQNELMKIINTAEFRVAKTRPLDVLIMLDSYWAKMLKEQIPDDSNLLATRPKRPVATAASTENENNTNEKSGFSKRLGKLKFW